ncbi:MAG: methyl-accepting chemotaxis protein [Desulfofundulus sp.]
MRLKVGVKIGGAFLILLVLFAFIMIQGIVVIDNISRNMNDINKHFLQISLDYQIKDAFQAAVLAMHGYMFYGDEKYLAQYHEQIKLTEKLLEVRLQNVSNENRGKLERMSKMVKEFDGRFTRTLLEEGKVREAAALESSISPMITEINNMLQESIVRNETARRNIVACSTSNERSGRQKMLILGFIVLLFSSGLTFFISRSITTPVKTVMESLRRIADGDFTQPVHVRSRDELGDLAATFDLMREQLRALVGEIASTAENVAAHSEELVSSAEEVNAAVEEVASATSQVAATAGKSLEDAHLAAAESRNIAGVAESGGQTIKKTIEIINAMARTGDEVNHAIRQLGELSLRIGDITGIITSIADQTNLLALNAAIEAARAGEQGRGFAVVAEEVRKLAEQSAGAAGEISQLISRIQSGVEAAVRAMDHGVTEIQEGVGIASAVGDALKKVEEAIYRSITLIEEITERARQTGDVTQQLAASAGQVSSTIRQVTTATQELAQIASNLQLLACGFKV